MVTWEDYDLLGVNLHFCLCLTSSAPEFVLFSWSHLIRPYRPLGTSLIFKEPELYFRRGEKLVGLGCIVPGDGSKLLEPIKETTIHREYGRRIPVRHPRLTPTVETKKGTNFTTCDCHFNPG